MKLDDILLPAFVRVICDSCWGQNPRCAKCLGRQYVDKAPYDITSGEMAVLPEELMLGPNAAQGDPASPLVEGHETKGSASFEGQGIS